VEAREDVLVYPTPPLAQDLEVTGPVASNSMQSPRRRIPILRRSWWMFGRMGLRRNLTEGILRERYRESQEAPTLINPGRIYKLAIDLWATSNVFKKGHVCDWRFPAAIFRGSIGI
jgi:predicted acyl esterase